MTCGSKNGVTPTGSTLAALLALFDPDNMLALA